MFVNIEFEYYLVIFFSDIVPAGIKCHYVEFKFNTTSTVGYSTFGDSGRVYVQFGKETPGVLLAGGGHATKVDWRRCNANSP